MALYLLLRHVHELMARAMVVIVAVSVAIICLNLLNEYTALTLATSERYATAFGVAGSGALAGLFADMHEGGYLRFVAYLLVRGVRVSKPKVLSPVAA